MTTGVKLTRVAAAVIERRGSNGTWEYLLGQRAPGTFYPGYWEFPGGKVEPGETPYQALVRELEEELGIRVLQAQPWLMRCHRYEHAHVELNFFRVRAWEGELCDHVHSALAWQQPGAVTVEPMLPANGPILKALSLPDFYAITHAYSMGIEPQLLALEKALQHGLRLVQIREHGLESEDRESFACAASGLCRQYGALVLINGDEALARACSADGLHLPARQLMQTEKRPDFPWVGASCHTAEELTRAENLGLDFAVVGTINPTASHPDRDEKNLLGWAGLEALIARSEVPVFAIGGLTGKDLETAKTHRAHGIAAIRAAWS